MTTTWFYSGLLVMMNVGSMAIVAFDFLYYGHLTEAGRAVATLVWVIGLGGLIAGFLVERHYRG